MNLKELLFGGGVKDGGSGQGAYRDSIQAWLPIKNIIGGVAVTKDNRFIKILEVLPVNIYLKSAGDRQTIISAYAAYLKIAPDSLQMEARTIPADTAEYVERMRRYAEREENAACREMIEDNIQEIGQGVASEAIRRRFFLVFQYEAQMKATEHRPLHHSAAQRGSGYRPALSGSLRAGGAGATLFRRLYAQAALRDHQQEDQPPASTAGGRVRYDDHGARHL